MSSIFSKILTQEIKADIIWQDEDHFAIFDIDPNNPGHLLVIPKKEVGYVFDLSNEEYTNLFVAVKKLAVILKEVTHATRIGLVIEGLGVPDHVHVHLIPINEVGELDSSHKVSVTKEENQALAEKIKSAILNNQ